MMNQEISDKNILIDSQLRVGRTKILKNVY